MRTLVAATLSLALFGCGRIAFDGIGGSDGGPDPDAAWPTLAGRWTWMGGSTTADAPAVYGTQGAGDANTHPGARDNGGMWVVDGRLVLFGGVGWGETGFGAMSDVWAFDPTSRIWTWISGAREPDQAAVFGQQGVPSLSNVPPGRNDTVTWVDQVGTLWMFGGTPQAATYLDDLWRFDPITGAKAWMRGDPGTNAPAVHGAKGVASASSDPGARGGAVVWPSADGVYLYGGQGFNDDNDAEGAWSDLWHYELVNNTWTWIAGPSMVDTATSRGTKGVASATNSPGAFGMCAFGDASTGALGLVDNAADVWSFDLATKQWTWESGPGADGALPMARAMGEVDPSNTPGERGNAACWTDLRGNVWLFGGQGRDAANNQGTLQDLWVYQPSLQQWAFVAGTLMADYRPIYGALGVPDAGAMPGSRNGGATWLSPDGQLWMLGGDLAYDAGNGYGEMGDLWRFSAD